MRLTKRAFLSMSNAFDPEKRGIYVKLVLITPAIAAEWLELNANNRSKKKKLIDAISKQIVLDKFSLNGETIIFSTEGLLLDGQNRLHAVVRSGRAIESLVVFGVETEAQKTMDTGKHRTGADALHLDGYTSTNVLAYAIRELAGFVYGEMHRDHSQSLPPQVFTEFIKAFPDIEPSITKARSSRDVASQGLVAAFHYIFSHADKAKADKFVELLTKGKGRGKTNPVASLVSELNKTKGGGESRFVVRNIRRAWFIRAWNALYKGRGLTQHQLTEFGEFPEIEGLNNQFLQKCQKFSLSNGVQQELVPV